MNLGQQPNPKRNKEKGKQGSYTGEHFPYIFLKKNPTIYKTFTYY